MRTADRASGRAWPIALSAILLSTVVTLATDKVYEVQKGDTLYQIARRSQTTVERLLQVNHLAADTALKVGQKLALPEIDSAAGAPGSDPTADNPETAGLMPEPPAATYQVQAGDNLYRIAERLGIAVETLTWRNGLTSKSILQIGQTLRVPADAPGLPQIARTAVKATQQVAAVMPTRTVAKAQPPQLAAQLVTLTDINVQPTALIPPTKPGDEAQVPEAVWVTESRVRLRTGPSMQAASLKVVTCGQMLKVTGKSGMWWRVELSNGQTAYVAGWVVGRQAPGGPAVEAEEDDERGADEMVTVMYVAQPKVTARFEPSAGAEVVAEVTKGTRVSVVDVDDEWILGRFDNGNTGWLPRAVLKRPSTGGGEAQVSHSVRGDGLVQTALSYVGLPYVRGGTSRSGVDCSGLVYAVCRQHGISLPRTSRDQWGHGNAVGRGNLRPGDIVFFKNTYRAGISHVGIYVGNNQFVHAVRPGRGVQVSSLNEGYYTNRWAGAFRVTN